MKKSKLYPFLIIIGIIFLFGISGCEDQYFTENNNTLKSDVLTTVPIESVIKLIPTASGVVPYMCDTYARPNGEIYLICCPVGWTGGDLAIYAHGYISVFEPIQLPVDEIAIALPLVANFGMAFATTSFSKNGLVIQTGIEEIRELKNFFSDEYVIPDHVFLTGGSQGGLITTLALERYPGEFDGGFSTCGPCGDFQRQLNHYGDFRLLFDYYFPGILPQDPENPFTKIPPELIEYWENGPSGTPADSYSALVIAALIANPTNAQKLMSVSKAPYDPADINTLGETVLATLWYHIFTIENSIEVFGGLAYYNTGKKYSGTGNFIEDMLLNFEIPRIKRDNTALNAVKKYYETSGEIKDPLIMMHTTLDPIQLYEQQELYNLKILKKKCDDLFKAYGIEAYGHCNFTPEDMLLGFNALISKVAALELSTVNNN